MHKVLGSDTNMHVVAAEYGEEFTVMATNKNVRGGFEENEPGWFR